MSGAYRLPIGEYRAVFEVLDQDGETHLKIIHVSSVGPRGSVYG